jgi:hypothetical protein
VDHLVLSKGQDIVNPKFRALADLNVVVPHRGETNR